MNAPARILAHNSMSATTRLADLRAPDEARRIEAFVESHPDATPFHRPAWLLAVAQGTGNRPLALVLEQGARWSAICR
jgi:hypothetical protein